MHKRLTTHGMKTPFHKFFKNKLITLIIGVVFVLGIVLFAFFFFRTGTYITVTVKVGEAALTPSWRLYGDLGTNTWFSQLYNAGMKEKDGFGRPVAEVLNIYSYNSSPNSQNVYLTVKLKAIYNRSTGQYLFRGKPILAGSEIKLYLDTVYTVGIVSRVGESDDENRKYKVVVKAQLFNSNTTPFLNTTGVYPFFADALNEGDTLLDSQKNPIITIQEKQISDALIIVPQENGRSVFSSNGLLKDVVYTLEINAVRFNDKYFVFDDIPIIIGNVIPLHTDTVSVYPTITNIVSIIEHN